MNAVGEGANAALRARPQQPQIISAPESSTSANGNASAPANGAAPPPASDPDASPATAPPKKQKSQPSSPPPEPADEPARPTEPGKPASSDPAPAPAPTPAPALSPVVAVEESPKGTAAQPAGEDLEAVIADGSEGSSSEDGRAELGWCVTAQRCADERKSWVFAALKRRVYCE
jgi:hypothetical protein